MSAMSSRRQAYFTQGGASALLGDLIPKDRIRNRVNLGLVKGGVWAYNEKDKPVLVALAEDELPQFTEQIATRRGAGAKSKAERPRPGLDARGAPLFYTITGAAAKLGVRYQHIRYMEKRGEIKDAIYAIYHVGKTAAENKERIVAIPASEVRRLRRRPNQRPNTRGPHRKPAKLQPQYQP